MSDEHKVLLRPHETFLVTVTRIRVGRVTTREYVNVGTRPKKDRYDKTDVPNEFENVYENRDVEKDATLETKIFSQEVETINLAKVILAVNDMSIEEE